MSDTNWPSQNPGGSVVLDPADTQETGRAVLRRGPFGTDLQSGKESTYSRHLLLRDKALTARHGPPSVMHAILLWEALPDGVPVLVAMLSSWVTPGELLDLSEPRSCLKRGQSQHPPHWVVRGTGAKACEVRGVPPCDTRGAPAGPTHRREQRVPETRTNAPASPAAQQRGRPDLAASAWPLPEEGRDPARNEGDAGFGTW